MKLNVWQKVGIVFSILWTIGAGTYTRHDDVERAENFAKFSYDICAEHKLQSGLPDRSDCEDKKLANINVWMKDSAMNVTFVALAPIPFGWLAVFILFHLYKIQLTGVQVVVPWGSMSFAKKAFTVFCIIAIGIGVLSLLLTVLNLYTETRVPVALPVNLSFIKTGNDMVHIKGTWTRHGSTEKSAMAFPLQTSTIFCYRNENRCTEARAYVSENLLESELLEYEIKTWTKESIIMKNDSMCAEEIYTIDFNTETVNGMGHRINKDSEYCKNFRSSEVEWSYRLEKGFPVYWDLRAKARPRILRIIHSVFAD